MGYVVICLGFGLAGGCPGRAQSRGRSPRNPSRRPLRTSTRTAQTMATMAATTMTGTARKVTIPITMCSSTQAATARIRHRDDQIRPPSESATTTRVVVGDSYGIPRW